MQRRTFFKTAGVAATAAAGAGAFGILRHPRARAGWGEWPVEKEGSMIPAERQAKRVLELYLYGGMNAFDTFYTVPSWGMNDERYLHAYYPQTVNRFGECGFNGELTEPFAEDSNGETIHLGPWISPLRSRPDITSRMRVLVQRHDLLPHEGANPYALTGSRLGSPRLAGVGAAIQRHFLDREGGLRATPYAYVLYPGVDFPTDNVRAASAVGFHPGSARPLSVTVDPNSQLSELLARPGVAANREQFDKAVDYYLRTYQNRFRPGGKGQPTRSQERRNYEFAHFARQGADQLQSVLGADLFEPLNGPECGEQGEIDKSRMQARMAASLLTRATDDARYVQWIDGGLMPNGSGGHDTHDNHVNDASRNVSHAMQCLADIINAPGETDPAKINLDETMIVINTEFGRTPHRQGDNGGLNHWPQGMINVLIGGPITEAEKGIYGAITEQDGFATTWVTPAENRMLIMMALGIFPFSNQTFAGGDVVGAPTEYDAATRLRDIYMGLKL